MSHKFGLDQPMVRARRVTLLTRQPPSFPSTLVLWLPEQKRCDVGYLWRLAAPKGHRAADGHGGQPHARRQKAVEHAFAEAGRQSCGDPMADELLDEAVADRHAPRDREMRDNRAQQLEKAEQARPAAIDDRDAPDKSYRLRPDEDNVDDRARRKRRHHGHALCRARDFPPYLQVQRPDKRALGNVDEIAAVDDVARNFAQLSTRAKRYRALRNKARKDLNKAPCLFKIVLFARAGESNMKFRDMALAENSANFLRPRTISAVPAAPASARPMTPKAGDQAKRSSMSRVSQSPKPSETRPPVADQKRPPQDHSERATTPCFCAASTASSPASRPARKASASAS